MNNLKPNNIMKNIHVLPTDKLSRLFLNKNNDTFFLNEQFDYGSPKIIAQNIYITSDEEIKEGDWHLVWLRDKWEVLNYMPSIGYRKECLGKEVCKIILTTDQDLIKDGIQAINDDFLEWFVKNPSCEFVEVINDTYTVGEMSKLPLGTRNHKYKLIIPKEEPKQETLEEAAERYTKEEIGLGFYPEIEIAFEKGAKWQQEKTIEEVFEWLISNNYLTDLKETLIENFKNRLQG
jgi:hypothetical protein